MTLRLKLTLWYSAVVAGTLIVFSLILYNFLTYSLVQETDKGLAGRAISVVRSIKVIGPTFLRPEQIVLPDVDVFGYPNIFLQVVDINGRLVAKSSSLSNQSLPLSRDTIKRGMSGQGFYEWYNAGEQRIRIYNYPLVSEGRVVGLLQVGQPFSGIQTALSRLRWLLWLLSGIMILAGGTIGWWLARAALKPVEEISKTAAIIQKELNFHQRIAQEGPNDELGRLVATLNGMLNSLESAYRELEESVAAQKRLVADLSHELRTPLTTIRGNIALIGKMGDDQPEIRQEALVDIASEAERMSRLISDMLVLARADAGLTLPLQPLAVEPLIEQVGRQAKILAKDINFKVTVDECCRESYVMGDQDYIKQLILILLDNAFKFTPAQGSVELYVQCSPENVEVQVRDTGVGIDQSELDHVFERFYRSDKSRPVGGTGLGLSIAQWIAQQHNAQVLVKSKLYQGSVFMIKFPTLIRNP